MPFKEFINDILKSPTVRKSYVRILDDHVEDESYTPTRFLPDQAYFTIALSEMYLLNKREYWREFIPLCLVISEFMYDGRREIVPFFVGNQLLSSIETKLSDQEVEYRNTTVVGPLPYTGDNICLFVGMFRAVVDDFAKTLFGFFEEIAGNFALSGFSAYLDIAKIVAKGLPNLLKMDTTEYRFGTRDEFSSVKRKGNTFKRGYLAYVNCPEENINPQDLWVTDGRLVVRKGRQTGESSLKNDFCLIKIDHFTERDDYQMLPFYTLWKGIKSRIWDGQIEKARKELLPQLARAVSLSPDLVRSDKFHLQDVFKVNFEREADSYFNMIGGGTRGKDQGATRGPDEQLDARTKIQKAAIKGEKISKDVETALFDIVEKWDRIPHLEPSTKSSELTGEILKEQLQSLKKITSIKNPDPDALAETLVADSISFQSH